MEFLQVDVFATGAYTGNPLAVFPDAAGLDERQMQAIAAEMNLSETTFVTDASGDEYSVRIFTPREELPLAGHPTLGTAWALRRMGALSGDRFRQTTAAGVTEVSFRGDLVWFRRAGSVADDLSKTDPAAEARIARALGLEPGDIGLEPRELGRSLNRLRPALADIGISHLLVPLRDAGALESCRPVAHLVTEASSAKGAYCFTATRAGALRARGFFPAFGIEEDPATGSAAACLGVYLADRLGDIELDIEQGVEMGRPSQMSLSAKTDAVEVGGRCELIFDGRLVSLP